MTPNIPILKAVNVESLIKVLRFINYNCFEIKLGHSDSMRFHCLQQLGLGDVVGFYNVKVGYEAQRNKNDEGNKQKFIRITSAGTATNYST